MKDKTFEVSNSKRLHFIHLNINIVLPKIKELYYIAKGSNAALTGITETKLSLWN